MKHGVVAEQVLSSHTGTMPRYARAAHGSDEGAVADRNQRYTAPSRGKTMTAHAPLRP
jgi:hypothetical protein